MTGLMTFAEFRRIRDTVALENYAQRMPVLRDYERRLTATTAYYRQERDAAKRKTEREQWETKFIDESRKLQTITAHISAIEQDEPIRKARLAELRRQTT